MNNKPRILNLLVIVLLFGSAFLIVVPTIQKAHAANPTLDLGVISAVAASTASIFCNANPTNTNDFVYVVVGASNTASATIPTFTISDNLTSHLTWHERTHVGFTLASPQGVNETSFYAIYPNSPKHGIQITVAISPNAFPVMTCSYFSNTRTTAPFFDPNFATGLTTSSGTSVTTATVTATTVASGDLVVSNLWLPQQLTKPTDTQTSGATVNGGDDCVTNTNPCGPSGGFLGVFYGVLSGTLSSAAETYTFNSNQMTMMFDAICAGSGSCTANLPAGGNCTSVTSCTLPLSLVTANTAIVLAVQISNTVTSEPASVSDTLGNVFTDQVDTISCSDFPTCANGNVVDAAIFTANSGVTGNDIITITTPGTAQHLSWELYDPSGVVATPSCTAVASIITSSVNLATRTACAYTPGSFIVASLSSLGSFALSAGAGFTLQSSGVTNMQAQSFTAQSSASTYFPATIATATASMDVGLVLGPTSLSATVILGSCPNKNTATFTMVNNTEYFYTGTLQANEIINTVTVAVAKVTSVIPPQTLTIGVYVTPNPGAISVANPFLLAAAYTFPPLSGGTSNKILSVNIGQQFTSQPGSTFGIAVLGDSKIQLNQSSLSGLSTGATSGGILSASFTSLTSVTTQIYLCSSLTVQAISTVTVSTTLTSISTSTVQSNNVPVSTNANLYLALAVIILPALIGVKLAGAGGMALGGLIGSLAAVAASLIPPVYLVAILVGFVALFFLGRSATGGGTGV